MSEDAATDRMTLDRLVIILDCYGAAAERWPADERRSALALLEASADARALRATAGSLDGALSLMQPPPTSERAMERVRGMVRSNPPVPKRRRVSWMAEIFAISLPQAAAFASVAVVAFLMGASLPYWGGSASPQQAATPGGTAVIATADTQAAETSTENGNAIGDLAIVDGLPDVIENETLELASAESTESVDSLTDIPLQ